MRLNCVNKVMQLHIEEVAVPFEGRGADGCDALIYNCEADEWGSPSSVDKVVYDGHYECKERIEELGRYMVAGLLKFHIHVVFSSSMTKHGQFTSMMLGKLAWRRVLWRMIPVASDLVNFFKQTLGTNFRKFTPRPSTLKGDTSDV